MESEAKKFSVSIDPQVKPPKSFFYFLVRSSEDALYIDLAEKEETDSEIVVTIKESVAISSDVMLNFTVDILKELIEYEKKYKNGKGLPQPD